MAQYLLQYAYTAKAWVKQLKEEDGDIGVARQVAKDLGGTLVNGWFTFGDYDVAAIIDVPDHLTAAAVSVALSSAGYARAAKTTPLMTEAEGKAMLRKAKSAKVAAVEK
jgi:uncharacterized protein with GYD domain